MIFFLPFQGHYDVPFLPARHEDLEYLVCQILLHPAKNEY